MAKYYASTRYSGLSHESHVGFARAGPEKLWDAPPWAVMGGPAFISEAEGPEDDISLSRL